MNFTFLSFKLDDLAQNAALKSPEFEMSASAKKTAYPLRAIRYWWVCQVLSRELIDKPDATIVDMGAGQGQLKRYCAGSVPFLSPKYPLESQHWIGLDRELHSKLSTAGYEQLVECDFDKTLPLKDGSVDALICIHVMEHLPRPEFTVSEIARVLAPGGIFCGGSPTAPGPVSFFLHRWLRSKMRKGTTAPNGHINSLSPGDWKRLVRDSGLRLNFLSGSHLMRLSGSPIENSKIWAKLNLLWGSLFPSLGSEVYLQAQKDA